MTARQNELITRLANERDTAGLTQVQRDYLAELLTGATEPNPAQASRIIEALLELPALPAVDVPAGRYALDTEDGVKFYTVARPTEGKWAGRLFLNVQASDDEWPVKNAATKLAVLRQIGADVHGAMLRYGLELGACGKCGRTLTDETSRAMGIGPECAKALGLDRTPYTVRAERERADALLDA